MHSWGHRQAWLGYSNTVRVSTEHPLWDKNPSSHQEIKPASSQLPFLSDTLPNHPTPLYLKLIHAARQERKQTDHGELGGDLLLFTVQRLDLFLQLLTGQLRQFQGLVQTCHGTAQVSITIQQGIPLYSNNILVQTCHKCRTGLHHYTAGHTSLQ